MPRWSGFDKRALKTLPYRNRVYRHVQLRLINEFGEPTLRWGYKLFYMLPWQKGGFFVQVLDRHVRIRGYAFHGTAKIKFVEKRDINIGETCSTIWSDIKMVFEKARDVASILSATNEDGCPENLYAEMQHKNGGFGVKYKYSHLQSLTIFNSHLNMLDDCMSIVSYFVVKHLTGCDIRHTNRLSDDEKQKIATTFGLD